MKLSWKREILPAVLAAGMFVAAFYYYPLLPNSLPVHFGLKGQPNGWASKPVFFLENTGIFCFTYLLLTFLPFIDPLKRKIEPKFKTVILLRDVILVFSAVVYFVAIEYARAGGTCGLHWCRHRAHAHRSRQLHAEGTSELVPRNKNSMGHLF